MDGLRRHLSYANVVATLALVIAIAGGTTAIAVSKGKRADINKKGNIRTGHVTTPKLADGAVTAPKVAAGNVTAGALAGVDVVQVTGGGIATATCPNGERLMTGGAIPETGGQTLATSSPSEGGNGWTASTAGKSA